MTRTWVRSGAVAATVMMMAASAYAQAGQSQGSGNSPRQSSSSHDQTSGSKDKQYVQKMMRANMAEIPLGQMASQRASSSEVKSFAQIVLPHHTNHSQE